MTSNAGATGGAACGGPTDYISVPNGSVSVPANSNNTIPITTCTNAPGDPAEQFIVNLTATSSGSTIATSSAVGTIEGTAGGGDISIDDDSCTAGTTCNFTVTRLGGVGSVTVTWSTSNGTALGTGGCPATPAANQDYVVSGGTVSVGANGGTAPINITTCTNAAGEPSQTFNVNLNSASSGTITDGTGLGTITN
jgi:hypothetical protein